ncbi:MAG: Eco57I restriction-modification methylase domain-containing protein [Promethearchaeota archaeon]
MNVKVFNLFVKSRNFIADNINLADSKEDINEIANKIIIQMLIFWRLQNLGIFNNNKDYLIEYFKKIDGIRSNELYFNSLLKNLKEGFSDFIIVDINGMKVDNKVFYEENLEIYLKKKAITFNNGKIPILNLLRILENNGIVIDSYFLGSIYDKLLEKKSRKRTGSYYTPKQISSYICKTLIIEYIKDIVRSSEDKTFLEIEIKNLKDIFTINNPQLFIKLFKKLEELRILDPCIGCGHFLEIFMEQLTCIYIKIIAKLKQLRYNDSLEIEINRNGNVKKINLLDYFNKKSLPFYIKRYIIVPKNLYGIDLNLNAVNITKIRLFLSIIKDAIDKKKAIKTLSQIKVNLKQGNFLLDFENLNNIKSQKANKIKRSEENLFNSIIDFSEIYNKRCGFDIILGNPPYGNILSKRELAILSNSAWRICISDDEGRGSKNAAGLFVEKSYALLKENGYFGMILPNSIERIPLFKKLRNNLLKYTKIFRIMDDGFPFSGANLEMATIFFKKCRTDDNNVVICKSRKIKGKWSFTYNNAKKLGYFPLYHDNLQEYILSLSDIFFGDIKVVQGRPRRADYIEGEGIRCLSSRVIDPYLLKLDKDTDRIVSNDFKFIKGELESELLITPYFFGTSLASLKKDVFEVAIKPKGFITDGNGILIRPLKEKYFYYYQILLNSAFCNYYVKKYILNYSIRDITIRQSTIEKFPFRYPKNVDVFNKLAFILNAYSQISYDNASYPNENLRKLKEISDCLIFEIYFQERLQTLGFYSDMAKLLSDQIAIYFKTIPYKRWSELYWDKVLKSVQYFKQDQELEKLNNVILEKTNNIIKKISKDQQINIRTQKIKNIDWIKKIQKQPELY